MYFFKFNLLGVILQTVTTLTVLVYVHGNSGVKERKNEYADIFVMILVSSCSKLAQGGGDFGP